MEELLVKALRYVVNTTWLDGPNAQNIICEPAFREAIEVLKLYADKEGK